MAVKPRLAVPPKKVVAIADDFEEDDEGDLLTFSALDSQRQRGTKRGRGFGTASSAAIAAISAAQHQEEDTDTASGVQYSAAHLAGLRASQMVLGSTPTTEAATTADTGALPSQPTKVPAGLARTSIPKDEPWLASDAGSDSPLAAQHRAAAVLAQAVASSGASRLPSRGTAPFAAARIALDAVPRRFVDAIAASRGHAVQAQAQLKHFALTAEQLQSEDGGNQRLLADMSHAFDVLSDAHRRMHWAVRVARAAAITLQHLGAAGSALRSAHRSAALRSAAATQAALDSVSEGVGAADSTGGPWRLALEMGPPPPAPFDQAAVALPLSTKESLSQACTGHTPISDGLQAAAAALEAVLSAASSSPLPPQAAALATAACASRYPQTAQDMVAASSLDGAFLALQVAADSAVAAADAASDEPQGVSGLEQVVPAMLQCAQRFKTGNPRAYADTYCSMTMGSLLYPVLQLQAVCVAPPPQLAAGTAAVEGVLHAASTSPKGGADAPASKDEANCDSTLVFRGVLSAQLSGMRDWLQLSWSPVSASSTQQASAALQRMLHAVAKLPAAVTSVAPLNSSRAALVAGLSAAALKGAQSTVAALHLKVQLPSATATSRHRVCSAGTLVGVGALLQLLRGVSDVEGLFQEQQVQLRSFCVEEVLGDRVLAVLTAMAASSACSPAAPAVVLQLAATAVQAVPSAWWADASNKHDWSMALTAIGEELLSQCCAAAAAAAAGDAVCKAAATTVAAALSIRSPQLAAQLKSSLA